jgi:hypothetical protein
MCRWLARAGDVLEPWLFLPFLFMSTWLSVLLQQWTVLDTGVVVVLATILVAVVYSVFCIALVWSQAKDEEERATEPAQASRTAGDRNQSG